MTKPTIGIIGGTGPQGRGLAARWARAGFPVIIGSRTAERGEEAAEDARGRVGDVEVDLRGGDNLMTATEADIVVVAVPYEAQAKALPALTEAVGNKIVCNVVNPMTFDKRGASAIPVEAGSAGEENAEFWPDARLVSGFHDVSATRLLKATEPIVTHVLLCGDDLEAVHEVGELAHAIDGMYPVYAGPLRNSSYIENLTCVLLAVNKHYRVHAGVIIDGVEPPKAD